MDDLNISGLAALVLRTGEGNDFVTLHPDATSARADAEATVGEWYGGSDPSDHTFGSGPWDDEGFAIVSGNLVLPRPTDTIVAKVAADLIAEAAKLLESADADEVAALLRQFATELRG